MVCQIAQWGENQNTHILHSSWLSHWEITWPWQNNFPVLLGFSFTDWRQGGHVIELKENKIWGWMFCSDPCPSGPSNSLLTGPFCPLCSQHPLPLPPAARDPFKAQIWLSLFSLKSQGFSQQLLQPHLILCPVRSCLFFRQATHCCRRAFVCTILLPLFPKLLFITQPNLRITPLEQLTSHTTPVPWWYAP